MHATVARRQARAFGIPFDSGAHTRHPYRGHTLTVFTAAALLTVILAGCGGGGGGGGGSSDGSTGGTTSASSSNLQTTGGRTEGAQILSRANGTQYALRIYLPPASAGARADLPVLYLLDAETRFQEAVAVAEVATDPFMIVGIETMGRRGFDYTPPNTCTPGGGGHVAFFNFIRQDLIPYIETTFGGSPSKRILFGHSLGGILVLYALFAEAPDQHTFKAYMPSDTSIPCITTEAERWEQDYARSYADLPVRLHLSSSGDGNFSSNRNYGAAIAERRYPRLVMTVPIYNGSHTGIVPQVLAEGVPFSIATTP